MTPPDAAPSGPPTLVIATRNLHKAREIQTLLPPNVRVLSLRDFPNAPIIPEDADTFAGNATRKAVELARWLSSQPGAQALRQGQACMLADDSGLEVDALQGAPGVRSARFAALDSLSAEANTNSPDAANNAKLLRLLRHVPLPARTARFRCVLALVPLIEPSPRTQSPVCYADEFELHATLFEGVCQGHIAFAPSGHHGFGYDPLFIPEGYAESFAQLGEDVKNRISHRARALEKLRARWPRPAAPQP